MLLILGVDIQLRGSGVEIPNLAAQLYRTQQADVEADARLEDAGSCAARARIASRRTPELELSEK